MRDAGEQQPTQAATPAGRAAAHLGRQQGVGQQGRAVRQVNMAEVADREAVEAEDQGGYGRAGRTQTQAADEEVHPERRQEQPTEGDEHQAVGKDEEGPVEGEEGADAAVGEQGEAAEHVGRPEGQLAAPQGREGGEQRRPVEVAQVAVGPDLAARPDRREEGQRHAEDGGEREPVAPRHARQTADSGTWDGERPVQLGSPPVEHGRRERAPSRLGATRPCVE